MMKIATSKFVAIAVRVVNDTCSSIAEKFAWLKMGRIKGNETWLSKKDCHGHLQFPSSLEKRAA
jgi:hypothetical protein